MTNTLMREPHYDRRSWWRADEGRISAFVVTIMTAILAMLGLVLDGGLALADTVTADNHAQAAARAGAQAIDLAAYRATGALHLEPALAAQAARAFLTRLGETGSITVTADTITVTITTTYRTQLLTLVGIPNLTVHGHGSARPERAQP